MGAVGTVQITPPLPNDKGSLLGALFHFWNDGIRRGTSFTNGLLKHASCI